MKFEDDMDAYRDSLAVKEADDGALIDAAFRAILRGDFDAWEVLEVHRRQRIRHERFLKEETA